MIGAPIPQGYDVAKAVSIEHEDCLVTVGFDRDGGQIPRFLVRLHYAESRTPLEWISIARFDHNEAFGVGHDVYKEGLHIDVTTESGDEIKIHPRHNQLPANRGAVIRACVDYFADHAAHFIQIYREEVSPGGPPPWPDGGQLPPTLFTGKRIESDMTYATRHNDEVSSEELTELLADATETTAEEIERQADELEIDDPEDADVVLTE